MSPRAAVALLAALCAAGVPYAPAAAAPTAGVRVALTAPWTAPGTATGPAAGDFDPRRPRFVARVSPVPPDRLGRSHGADCPVPPAELRLVRLTHWGFDGTVHQGELVVHERAVDPVLHVFAKAFEERFPIRKMRVMAAYGGDDAAAMADDNTSAYNCRAVTGHPGLRSQHSYGDAVDINPAENPYVDRNGTVHPPGATAYLARRDRTRPGVVLPGGAVAAAFAEVGWQWGGRWNLPDYQHFSANGH
ncbi:M15 family metallopeptidase [Streptomyces sp. NPDC093225]|uniref:M15 family metallopeptidase n=1 Tax=Streptomyces sp. NPDC093225 TaxID=3366034 RepID=UPI003800C411